MIERVLIVGTGSAGKRHLEIAQVLLPNSDIRVLQRRSSTQKSFKSDKCFYELEEALRFDPHIAVIANPAPFHMEISTRLASAGCHLLIEKPIADGMKGVGRLLELEKTSKIVIQVGYNLRFLGSLQEFRQQIHINRIGQILAVHAAVGQFLPGWRPKVDYRQTVSAQAKLGGGVIMELSHEIDYLRWIFGEIAWVSAWIGRIGDLDIDVEDSASLTLGFGVGSLFSGGAANLTMDFLRQDPTRFCYAVGSSGSLRWDGLNGRVERYSPKFKTWADVYKRENETRQSYTNEWKSFLSCINSGEKPVVTGHDGLAALKIVKAAKLSHQKNGRRIHIT